MKLAAEHLATERLLADSGPAARHPAQQLVHRELRRPSRRSRTACSARPATGRIAGATRADYAEAAASVLVGDGHAGQVYELGGEPFTLAELAAEISRQSGQPVTYTDLREEKYAEMLVGVGLPAAGRRDPGRLGPRPPRGARCSSSAPTWRRLLGRPVDPAGDAVSGRRSA